MILGKVVTDAAAFTVGRLTDDSRLCKWLLQVTAISGAGATLTPTISADGTTFTPVGMTPVTGGAVVATAAAVGAWYIETSGGIVKFTITGTTPSVTISLVPVLMT